MPPRTPFRSAALIALFVLAPFTRAQVRAGATAPDGRRGLGAQTKLQDLLSLMRSTRDDDREFIAELHSAGTELRVLVASVAERYRQRGWLDWLPAQPEPDLDVLHALVHTLDADPLARLAMNDAGSNALAQMLLEPRFRARVAVLEAWRFELREIERGLAVLRAATDGFVELTQDEASNIATRVDVAASLVRAMRSDLEVLRPGDVDLGELQALASAGTELVRLASSSEGEGVRRAAIGKQIGEARAQAAKIQAVLFTPRLAAQMTQLLEWRARVFQESRPKRDEALLWLPDSAEGRAAQGAIARIPRDDRFRHAAGIARQGLGLDPLDEDLAWVAAHATDFHWGLPESRPFYDRFLALRGIRGHDHRTYQGKELDAFEREALDVVQRSLIPGRTQQSGF